MGMKILAIFCLFIVNYGLSEQNNLNPISNISDLDFNAAVDLDSNNASDFDVNDVSDFDFNDASDFDFNDASEVVKDLNDEVKVLQDDVKLKKPQEPQESLEHIQFKNFDLNNASDFDLNNATDSDFDNPIIYAFNDTSDDNLNNIN